MILFKDMFSFVICHNLFWGFYLKQKAIIIFAVKNKRYCIDFHCYKYAILYISVLHYVFKFITGVSCRECIFALCSVVYLIAEIASLQSSSQQPCHSKC